MNPFGQELRKILTQCKTSGVVSYAGRSAYIQLDPDLRARLEFVSLNIAGQYNALKLTILNRTEGAVDVNIAVVYGRWDQVQELRKMPTNRMN